MKDVKEVYDETCNEHFIYKPPLPKIVFKPRGRAGKPRLLTREEITNDYKGICNEEER